MSKEIEKKTQQKYYQAIIDGTKKFELRLADWSCEVGDILVLKEVKENGEFTGREIRKRVDYLIKTKDLHFFGKEDVDRYGYQILSLGDED